MKYLPFLFALIFITCSKQDAEENAQCNLTGTWRQVISIPGEPETILGTMKLESGGAMTLWGYTGFQYRTREDCGLFEYWHKSDKTITTEMSILRNDGLYLELEVLTGALDPLLNPIGVSGNWLFKKVE